MSYEFFEVEFSALEVDIDSCLGQYAYINLLRRIGFTQNVMHNVKR